MFTDLTQPALLLANAIQLPARIFFWLGLIVALTVLLTLIALWIRKKLLTEHQTPLTGFTLKSLRQLHATGQLSDDELAAAEAKAFAKSRSHYLGPSDPAGEEPEDLGHLSTGSEHGTETRTENDDQSSDKNTGPERNV